MAPKTTQRGQKNSNRRDPATSAPEESTSAKLVALAHGESVTATTPAVTIQGLQPGTHTFELVVTDDLGIASPPVRITVEVTAPTPTNP